MQGGGGGSRPEETSYAFADALLRHVERRAGPAPLAYSDRDSPAPLRAAAPGVLADAPATTVERAALVQLAAVLAALEAAPQRGTSALRAQSRALAQLVAAAEQQDRRENYFFVDVLVPDAAGAAGEAAGAACSAHAYRALEGRSFVVHCAPAVRLKEMTELLSRPPFVFVRDAYMPLPRRARTLYAMAFSCTPVAAPADVFVPASSDDSGSATVVCEGGAGDGEARERRRIIARVLAACEQLAGHGSGHGSAQDEELVALAEETAGTVRRLAGLVRGDRAASQLGGSLFAFTHFSAAAPFPGVAVAAAEVARNPVLRPVALTHLQTRTRLPGAGGVAEVAKRLDVGRTPLMVAIDVLHVKSAELAGLVPDVRRALARPGARIGVKSPVIMVLNGVLNAAVNGGIALYVNTFYEPALFARLVARYAADLCRLLHIFWRLRDTLRFFVANLDRYMPVCMLKNSAVLERNYAAFADHVARATSVVRVCLADLRGACLNRHKQDNEGGDDDRNEEEGEEEGDNTAEFITADTFFDSDVRGHVFERVAQQRAALRDEIERTLAAYRRGERSAAQLEAQASSLLRRAIVCSRARSRAPPQSPPQCETDVAQAYVDAVCLTAHPPTLAQQFAHNAEALRAHPPRTVTARPAAAFLLPDGRGRARASRRGPPRPLLPPAVAASVGAAPAPSAPPEELARSVAHGLADALRLSVSRRAGVPAPAGAPAPEPAVLDMSRALDRPDGGAHFRAAVGALCAAAHDADGDADEVDGADDAVPAAVAAERARGHADAALTESVAPEGLAPLAAWTQQSFNAAPLSSQRVGRVPASPAPSRRVSGAAHAAAVSAPAAVAAPPSVLDADEGDDGAAADSSSDGVECAADQICRAALLQTLFLADVDDTDGDAETPEPR